ncbi:MAG: lipocalin family protein [Pseudohongiellaceae bacterium]
MLFKTLSLLALVVIGGCQSSKDWPAIRTAERVDLERFAGDWYVIANIPTFIETEAFNAVESYSKPVDGKIATTFSFNKGSLSGPKKTYRPTGFVRENTGNAVWGMQFIWPFKAEYRIVYLDESYQTTIIGRSNRDYVWLMARQPNMPEEHYQRMVQLIEAEGYDISLLRKIPHSAL